MDSFVPGNDTRTESPQNPQEHRVIGRYKGASEGGRRHAGLLRSQAKQLQEVESELLWIRMSCAIMMACPQYIEALQGGNVYHGHYASLVLSSFCVSSHLRSVKQRDPEGATLLQKAGNSELSK